MITLVWILYWIAFILVSLYGINCHILIFLFKRRFEQQRNVDRQVLEDFYRTHDMQELPFVTTQIPIYNEMNVAERVLDAVAAFEYPKGKHEIQVLDDSTDETRQIIARKVKQLQAAGICIEHITRSSREGFKAGALKHGSKQARGEFLAIFDADFVPPSDFLLNTIPFFLLNQQLGFLQTRWGHLNEKENLITRFQSIGINGHFAVEQAARNWNNLFMNFNGTAGIFRKAAILNAGNWSGETLTEDLDLSYRIQLAGWACRYLMDVVVPAEIPSNINAFKNQQFRWAKGSIQTAIKLLPTIWAAPHQLFEKYQATLHLTHYLVHPLMAYMAIIAPFLLITQQFQFPAALLLILAGLLAVSFFGPSRLYWTSEKYLRHGLSKRALLLPLLICFGCGLALNNSKAVFEAVWGKKSDFIRTPKRGEKQKQQKRYAPFSTPLFLFELMAGFWCLAGLWFFQSADHYIAGYFLLIYTVGFLYVGGISFWAATRESRNYEKGSVAPSASPEPSAIKPEGSRFVFWGCTLGMFFVSAWMAQLGYIGKSVYMFTSLYLLGFAFLLGLIMTFPQHWPLKHQVLFIMLLSVVVHLVFLAFPASDDVNRYVWESYLLNKGVNPFFHAPDDPTLTPYIPELQDIWQGVNHKDASACYPPVAMLIFRLAAYLSPTLLFFNIVTNLFNLGVIGILILLAREYQLPLQRVLLYACNPLVLVFIAGEGHLDPIQLFFICACFYFFKRKMEHWGFAALGCAIMSKYFSVILFPFLLTAKNWKKSTFLFGTIVLSYLPFWGTGRHLFTSLIPFGTVMHYNDSLTVILREIFGSQATFVSVILLAACFGIIYLLVHDPLKSSYLAAACLLLFLSTLHSWYLTLVTIFLVFFPSRAWLFLHMAVAFTFPVLHVAYYTGVFQEIHWVKWFEFLPFYILLFWDTFENIHLFRIRKFVPVRNISVIIPTLNESEHIQQCLEACSREQAVVETIVVDADSTDKTREVASRLGAHVIRSRKGRGHQISAGVSHASGDVLVILHADCVVTQNILARIVHTLNEYPGCIGGAVGMSYIHHTLGNKLVACLNNMRARWAGIAFGDQAQFFRREALDTIGGFPDIMLMEDIELSMRLKEHGHVCFLPEGVIVSNRRWEKQGFWNNVRRVVWLSSNYLIQRRLGIGDPERRDFYERYYHVPHISPLAK